MSRSAAPRWREALTGLALLFSTGALGDQDLRDVNYLLIHDYQHPEQSRLLLFSDATSASIEQILSIIETADEVDIALTMTRHADHRERVRGLTMLSGVDDHRALDAAMELLFDPEPAVREEAIQLVMDHPDADVELAAAIGQGDSSAGVRRATTEMIGELSGD